MTTESFKAILDKPIEEIKAPPQLPAGTYDWRIKGHEFTESGKVNNKTGVKTAGVRFTVSPFAVGEDVDKDLISAMAKPFSEAEMRLTFWITEDSAFRLRDFLEKDVGVTGASLAALIPAATNGAFRGYVKQSVNEDSGKPYSEITKTFKIE